MLRFIYSDARHLQILFLSSFLLYGLLELNWLEYADNYLIIFSVCLVSQSAAIIFLKLQWHSLKSAIISALGLCLLLKASSIEVYALAAFLAVTSKFIIRHQKKHFFNPVNFALIAVILLTNKAWISPGQWGNGALLLIVAGSAACLVLLKVKRLEMSLLFLAVYGGLHFLQLIVYKAWPIDFWLHQMSSGSILLFAFFMITDPRTSPNHRVARNIWVVFIAILSFILSAYLYVFTAPIWVLFAASFFTPLLNKWLVDQDFKWLSPTISITTSK